MEVIMSVSIIGTGSYAPPYILDNTSLSKMVDTSDEWIIERTGIKNRHIAKDETTEDMAYKSALKCLDNTGIRASDLDMRSEEPTSELQSRQSLVCRLLLEKNKRIPQ